MSADEFTRLFSYMERRFNELEAKLESKADKSTMDNRFDQVMGRFDDLETELTSLMSQADRHETWIKKASPKIQIPYRVQ